ncbi:glycosyltransferase 87 family protein [Mycolicibacterium sediminis]|uniref:Polyprenol-phosphate-mannose-dependent alpha-(1-2)-phosphatidylinositol mannoside mannosyltransferase n=1 Tax=Mycolicibacterium sediminis TaxID=1286180 RepID=A0A7I7QXI7_9MYCO|nr:glycosyltransferase 87 family protein [Mycolicibacterium sediminis]BBY30550.1 polyprenol-phosphate-mannose-dependent alpha-(1-2)-phosphatidylinositol mannoside mannosyltransferase [Mycolicibacterium sediminis]
MSKWLTPERAARWAAPGWRIFRLLVVAGVAWAGWRLLGHTPYRIDIDVYRMGGRAWLNGTPLYSDGTIFHTVAGLDLPFTYPPLAAIVFAPFAWLPLPAAGAAITVVTFVLLIVSTTIVLTRLRVWDETTLASRPWVRRAWLAAAIVAPAVVYFEPIRANFEFGQINVVLMTLVIADLVPRRTPWPRGLLLGIGVALKLTPAVFVLYLLMRRDTRAIIVTAASTIGATLLGFALAWRDSLQYWTETVHDTDRIGTATLNTNQNIAGTLARLGIGDDSRFLLWTAACFVVLGVTAWATHRILRGDPSSSSRPFDEAPVVALICVAMFGLVVSPVSWSHHWVWVLPTLVVTAVVAYRYRDVALALAAVCGLALVVWTPITLLTPHEETAAPVWRQLAGGSYLWWALAVIVIAGAVAGRLSRTAARTRNGEPSVDAARVAAPN